MHRNGSTTFGGQSWIAVISGVLAVLFSALAGCSPADNNPGGRLRLVVSILPQQYFVERIGDGLVDVEVLVGPGQSPATYEPTPKQMAALADADAYFRIGVPFETALIRKLEAGIRDLHIVDTRQGIALRGMPGRHGNEHDHEGGEDPHFWLDPALVMIQAKTVCDELIRIDPVHEKEYQSNLERLTADLETTHAHISKKLAPLAGRKFLVFHPAFGYFAEAYGLRQVAIEVEGKEPGTRQLAEIVEWAKAEGVRVIFVQQQFSTAGARTIARAIGGIVEKIDPLAYDYPANLEYIADKIVEAYEYDR
ncbi:MAG: zinc ABC transporter substrate-binding protein [Candidatus Zixiibacteriota bacterium]|nr:MAG: zinc ABC transporter substrate-binding protein [candidate division Zixibacteria bacterium]